MSTLTPLWNPVNEKVVFVELDRPVVTVENSAYNSAKLCGYINSAVNTILINKLKRFEDSPALIFDRQIELLNRFCCILIDKGDLNKLQTSNPVEYLVRRAARIWV